MRSFTRQLFPLRILVWVFLFSASPGGFLDAQSSDLPFTNPNAMLEEMFGESNEEELRALSQVQVSIAEEKQLGEQILASGLKHLKQTGIEVEKAGRDVNYLQSLVETVKGNMKNRERYSSITVLVTRSPLVDARSIPGGTLVFSEGLLDKAGSEAALIGIVGHELSHLDHGHQLLPIKRQKLMKDVGSMNSLGSKEAMQFMTRLWARPFRPEDEREADRDGVAWAFAAGYDPGEMAKLFQSKAGDHAAAEQNPWASFFRSHPHNHERRSDILKQVKQLMKLNPDSGTLFIGRENLRKRVSRKQEAEKL